MQAFHNDPSIKTKYVDRMKAHIAADELIRGIGFDGTRGCAVGCTLNKYEHASYETELGIPQWLAYLEDKIFESMPSEQSKTFPLLFLEAIPVGADLELIKAPFLIYVLEKALTTFKHEDAPDVVKAIEEVVALWKRVEQGEVVEQAEWKKARKTAERAAYAAWASARAARAVWGEFGEKLLELVRGCE